MDDGDTSAVACDLLWDVVGRLSLNLASNFVLCIIVWDVVGRLSLNLASNFDKIALCYVS